jgi:hypothetical protein
LTALKTNTLKYAKSCWSWTDPQISHLRIRRIGRNNENDDYNYKIKRNNNNNKIIKTIIIKR